MISPVRSHDCEGSPGVKGRSDNAHSAHRVQTTTTTRQGELEAVYLALAARTRRRGWRSTDKRE